MEKSNLNVGNKFLRVAVIMIITLLIAVIINDIIKRCEDPKEPEVELVYDYKTDTIYIDRGYEIRYNQMLKEITKMRNAPAKTVIKWKEPDLKYITLEKVPDSIYVRLDSLKEVIRISDNYIKLLPKNPKLLDIDLNFDSLSLSLLNIDGRVQTYEYPIDLSIYDYKWLEGDLKYTRNSRKKSKVKNYSFNNLYLNGGYNINTQSPMLDMEYFITVGRFKLEANTGFDLKDVHGNVKLGYRLIK